MNSSVYGERGAKKDLQRSLRMLRMIGDEKCAIEPTGNPEMVLLRFVGKRRVKCTSKQVQEWLEKRYIKISIDKDNHFANLTKEGEGYYARATHGDFAAQHREVVFETVEGPAGKQFAARNMNESPLSRLYKSGSIQNSNWLDGAEFSAGERLRSDFEFSQLSPRVTASWDPTANLFNSKGGRRPTETINERAFAARERLNAAIEHVGPELSGILLDVCCYLKGLEQIEIERKWPRRSAKLALKIGLSVLARHYTPEQNRHRRKKHHWGAEGYRPEIG